MSDPNPFKLKQSGNPKKEINAWLKRIKNSKPHPDSVTEVRHVPGAKVELKPGWTAAKPEDFDGLMHEGMTGEQQRAFLLLHADALWTHHKLAQSGYGAIREALVDAGVPTEPWSLPGFEGMRNNPKYKKADKSRKAAGKTTRDCHVPGLLAGKPVGPGGRAASTNPSSTYSQQRAIGAAGIAASKGMDVPLVRERYRNPSAWNVAKPDKVPCADCGRAMAHCGGEVRLEHKHYNRDAGKRRSARRAKVCNTGVAADDDDVNDAVYEEGDDGEDDDITEEETDCLADATLALLGRGEPSEALKATVLVARAAAYAASRPARDALVNSPSALERRRQGRAPLSRGAHARASLKWSSSKKRPRTDDGDGGGDGDGDGDGSDGASARSPSPKRPRQVVFDDDSEKEFEFDDDGDDGAAPRFPPPRFPAALDYGVQDLLRAACDQARREAIVAVQDMSKDEFKKAVKDAQIRPVDAPMAKLRAALVKHLSRQELADASRVVFGETLK